MYFCHNVHGDVNYTGDYYFCDAEGDTFTVIFY